ncbi:MAG TPA: serine/threonine-protein kinase [Thermoanaerobaculia bacterium]|nr:serine/threonine-protein kinase [Thermoanaerobaculia bacterium]HQN09010.1 serine/threonine-protein kinase [Thermoanaerobaculia bacterium]HQP86951.1 serine/threonine-protein kinase [Thermoanaerobaculia bacterium]
MKADQVRRKFFAGVPRYEWIETLGQGGVGIVYKAKDLELEEVVAIKVLSPDIAKEDEVVLARFKREINLNRKIKHPNVARMYDFGISGEYPYITMEVVPGKDLWTMIRDEGRLPPARAVPILRQIARGCSAIHELGIVHRDLKSQNVVVDEQGAVAIVDFGLARWNLGGGFTLDSIILGTPQYMSPEQASGKTVDSRTDIYSIGIIAFEALTGQLPFTGDSPIAVAMMQINDPVPDLLPKFADVSPDLRAIVLKALRKDPAKRYATAADLEADLANADRLPTPREGTVPHPGGEDPLMAQLESVLGAVVLPAPPEKPRRPSPSDASAPVTRPSVSPRPAAARPAPTPPAAPEAPSRPPTVLIVASAPAERAAWKAGLGIGPCRVLEAGSGPEALEALVREPADLVLMDVALPGMDGFDVTRVIKSQANLVALPILLASDRLERSHYAFGIQSGANELLVKPIEPERLREAVRGLLRHRGFPVEDGPAGAGPVAGNG